MMKPVSLASLLTLTSLLSTLPQVKANTEATSVGTFVVSEMCVASGELFAFDDEMAKQLDSACQKSFGQLRVEDDLSLTNDDAQIINESCEEENLDHQNDESYDQKMDSCRVTSIIDYFVSLVELQETF